MSRSHRVAQNSNVPFPLPIRVSFPFRPEEWVEVDGKTKKQSTHLDTDRNIGENSQIDFCAFYDLYFALDHFLSGSKLLRAEADTHALYADTPFAVGKGCAFRRPANGNGDATFVSFDMLDLTRCEL